MKALLTATVAALALAATATAGNPSLCARDGWQSAQSQHGEAFSSLKECAQAREVFQPTLTSDRSSVTAGEVFQLTATGFHPGADALLYFAQTGSDYYFYAPVTIDENGNALMLVRFSGCGTAFPYDITLTLIDAFGVHAAVRITLC